MPSTFPFPLYIFHNENCENSIFLLKKKAFYQKTKLTKVESFLTTLFDLTLPVWKKLLNLETLYSVTRFHLHQTFEKYLNKQSQRRFVKQCQEINQRWTKREPLNIFFG